MDQSISAVSLSLKDGRTDLFSKSHLLLLLVLLPRLFVQGKLLLGKLPVRRLVLVFA